MRGCRVLAALVCALTGSADAQRRHPYRSEQPVTTATLFSPEGLGTGAGEYGPAFTPDGTTLYLTSRGDRPGDEAIVYAQFRAGAWTPLTTTSFSGRYQDREPFVTPDGARLLFASTRPDGRGGPDTAFDLYVVEREGDGWGVPRRLNSLVNSDDYDTHPSVAGNGSLYFGSRRDGGLGDLDIYWARWGAGGFRAAENLGPLINSPAADADPYIAPDESYLIFSSTREGGYGSGDLYVSHRRGRSWTEPRNLGHLVNTAEVEYAPLVTPDRRYLFFSRGGGQIYFIETGALGIGTP